MDTRTATDDRCASRYAHPSASTHTACRGIRLVPTDRIAAHAYQPTRTMRAMMNAVTPIRVFISSPGDLAPERAVVNQILCLCSNDRYKLMAYAWELGTPPVIGAQAQDLV